jgi:hypothetical protein
VSLLLWSSVLPDGIPLQENSFSLSPNGENVSISILHSMISILMTASQLLTSSVDPCTVGTSHAYSRGESRCSAAGRGPLQHASAIASYILIWRNGILALLFIPSQLIRCSSDAKRVCSAFVFGCQLVTPPASHRV